ncbi:hypothetical protein BGZ82_009944 [Podila clonocystis]|nr:hypothetical protein BGZ82_009944 [Podila clonocystis]
MSIKDRVVDPAPMAKVIHVGNDRQPDLSYILEEKTSTVIFDSGPFTRQYVLNSAAGKSHLEDEDMGCYEVEMECHQFLEHRCPSYSTESSDRPQQVRVENGRLPIEIRCLLGEIGIGVSVLQGVPEQCMLGLKNALPETIQRVESLESNDDRTQAAMIYFESNALPSIDPPIPHTILLLLRLDIILDAECSAHLSTLCPPQTAISASATTEHGEAQERFFDPMLATLAQTVLTQDYPLVFSATKIKHFVWVLEWAQVTANSVFNVYRRASCPKEKARMNSYIQTLQSRYPTIPSDDVRLLLEHVFSCHAYMEVLGRRCQLGVGRRTSALATDLPDADPVEPDVLGELSDFRELDKDKSDFGEIEDSDEDDFWDQGCEMEGDMEDMADVWAGFDSADEKNKDEEEEELWSDILQDY